MRSDERRKWVWSAGHNKSHGIGSIVPAASALLRAGLLHKTQGRGIHSIWNLGNNNKPPSTLRSAFSYIGCA